MIIINENNTKSGDLFLTLSKHCKDLESNHHYFAIGINDNMRYGKKFYFKFTPSEISKLSNAPLELTFFAGFFLDTKKQKAYFELGFMYYKFQNHISMHTDITKMIEKILAEFTSKYRLKHKMSVKYKLTSESRRLVKSEKDFFVLRDAGEKFLKRVREAEKPQNIKKILEPASRRYKKI